MYVVFIASQMVYHTNKNLFKEIMLNIFGRKYQISCISRLQKLFVHLEKLHYTMIAIDHLLSDIWLLI